MDSAESADQLADPAHSPLPPRPPASMEIGGTPFVWGARTYVMGIVNVTPDSFSGDGVLVGATPSAAVEVAVRQAGRMIAQGADLLDVGGESSRPGHADVSPDEELGRVVPVISAIRARYPDVPISIDTVKPAVARASLDAGADLINDVWGVGPSDALARVAAERQLPYVVMHNRSEPRYGSVVAEVVADLQWAVDRAVGHGCAWETIVVDPGIGFGKTAEQNLTLLRHLDALRAIGRPILLGVSRKSTIGKVLDVPADERLEGTLALTALAIRSGVDLLRVHDVKANVRAARMADAVVRGGWQERAAP